MKWLFFACINLLIPYFMGLMSLMVQEFLLLQLLQPVHFPFFISENAFLPAKNKIAAKINPTMMVEAIFSHPFLRNTFLISAFDQISDENPITNHDENGW